MRERLTGNTRSCSRYSPTSLSVIGAVGETVWSAGSSFWLGRVELSSAAATGSGALISEFVSNLQHSHSEPRILPSLHASQLPSLHPVISMDLPQPSTSTSAGLAGFRALVSAFKHAPTPHTTLGTGPGPGATPPLLVAVAPQCPTPTPRSRPPRKSSSSTPATSAKRRQLTPAKLNSKDPLLFAHLKPLEHRLRHHLDGIHFI